MSYTYVAILGACFLSSSASASPIAGWTAVHERRSGSGVNDAESSGASPQIWVPIIVVIAVAGVAGVLMWRKRAERNRTGSTGTRAAGSGAQTLAARQGPTELTADQLAGGTAPPTANPTRTGTAGRTRRARRARRTPSQISTHSLPEYNKEPGAQEVVIFRGPDDMEDATLPTTVIMPSVAEHEAEGSLHSRNTSDASSYERVPDTPHSQPLLQEDSNQSVDLSQQNLAPPPSMPTRGSMDTLSSSEESNPLMHVARQEPALPDPRGEAPAYFEAVDPQDDQARSAPIRSGLPNSGASETQSGMPPQRRSGFRSLFFGNHHTQPSSSQSVLQPPTGHNRTQSALSALSSEDSHQTHRTHRPSHSGSGSLLSLSPFRTISRQRSNNNLAINNLNSPSLISLNSISSPLTHTLVRTEFTYPKTGPTPEQLKLISSRESFTRFGMPYGADAIAFAASTSQHNLQPPPDFDAPGSETHLPQAVPTAGSSRLRSSSTVESHNVEDTSGNADSSDTPATHDNIRNDTTANETTANDTIADNTTANDTTSAADYSTSNDTTLTSVRLESKSDSKDPSEAAEVPAPSTLQPPGLLDVNTHVGAHPPSSFRLPPLAISSRSESRASSLSYATAAESLATPSDSEFDDSPSPSSGPHTPTAPHEPSTPVVTGRHLLEPSDATVTQSTMLTATAD